MRRAVATEPVQVIFRRLHTTAPATTARRRHPVPRQPVRGVRVKARLGRRVALGLVLPQLAPARVHQHRVPGSHLDALTAGNSLEVTGGDRHAGVE